MKHQRTSAHDLAGSVTRTSCAVLLMSSAWCSSHANAAPPACKQATTLPHLSSSRTGPRSPPRLHNTYDGIIVVRVVIEASGTVSQAAIQRTQLHAVGMANGPAHGYEDAVLTYAKQLRYAPRAQACSFDQTIVIQHR